MVSWVIVVARFVVSRIVVVALVVRVAVVLSTVASQPVAVIPVAVGGRHTQHTGADEEGQEKGRFGGKHGEAVGRGVWIQTLVTDLLSDQSFI